MVWYASSMLDAIGKIMLRFPAYTVDWDLDQAIVYPHIVACAAKIVIYLAHLCASTDEGALA